jgi:dolichyl-diphosphooligosaccharide--protein glycosyltransferase
MSDKGTVRDLLEERPELRAALESLVEVDDTAETWAYDDVPVDSGPFGELVNAGIVESVGEEYRLAEPHRVKAELGISDSDFKDSPSGSKPAFGGLDISRPTFDRTTVVIVASALSILALVRVHVFRKIYRDGTVVLSGNDPYYYQFWVERVIQESTGGLDVGALSVLPEQIANGEPLMVTTIWLVSELFGGDATIAGHVLAWYPVVSAVITAAFVYAISVKMTGDKRVGVAAILLLAIIPGHALRTSLGFADHHAFDYIWLTATSLGLMSLGGFTLRDLRYSKPVSICAATGIAITAQVFAWDAGPLLIFPVSIVVVLTAAFAVRGDTSPTRAGAPLLASIGIASLLSAFFHGYVGWQSRVVAFTPILLFLGGVGALLSAEGIRRTSGKLPHLIGIYVLGGVAGIIGLQAVLPSLWNSLTEELQALFARRGVAETLSLFSSDSFGFIFLLGFTLALALPPMVHGVRRIPDDKRWVVPTVYVWYTMGLAAVQVRFVGEFASFAAIFAGIGFIWAATWIDCIPPIDTSPAQLRLPDRGTLGTLFLLFLLIGSLGIVQVPVKTSQVTVDDATYETSQFIADRAATLNQSDQESYVLSHWGRNRVYNYFVNGQSDSYSYARSRYGPLISSVTPKESYHAILEGRVGYVVLSTDRSSNDPRRLYSRLVSTLGSRNGDIPGLGHYRALYIPPDESRIVYGVVPGAAVQGAAPANTTVSVSTTVTIPRATFTYKRQTDALANGTYSIRLAQPGTYQLNVDGETRTVTVSEAAVREGKKISV